RDAEKADLHAAYHRAVSSSGPSQPPEAPPSGPRASRGEIVSRAIVGEMGIGKTALVATFLAELPADARVLQVECSPVKSELPLATVGDLLREITQLGMDHSLDEAQATLRSLFGPLARSQHASRFVPRLAEVITGKQLGQQEDEA